MIRSCLRSVVLATVLAGTIPAGQAAPVIFTSASTIFNLGANDISVSIVNNLPAFALSGPVQVRASIVGALGDGARDGASLTPLNPVLARLRLGGNVAGGTGGASSIAASGGTGGDVLFAGSGVKDLNQPSNFTFLFSKPIPPTGGTLPLRMQMAGGIADGESDGVAAGAVQFPGKLGRGSTGRSGNPNTVLASLDVQAPLAPAAPEATFNDAAETSVDCDSALAGAICDRLDLAASFGLSGGNDVAAMLLRAELGGDAPDSARLVSYADLDSFVFDCAGACAPAVLDVTFTLSPGDAFAFAMRFEFDELNVQVPEPPALPLLATALLALLVRRRHSTGH